MLNFTEMRLDRQQFSYDFLRIYDGNTTSESAQLGQLDGKTKAELPAWFLGSGNVIAVQFWSRASLTFSTVGMTYRFKALYMQQTQGKFVFSRTSSNNHQRRKSSLMQHLRNTYM